MYKWGNTPGSTADGSFPALEDCLFVLPTCERVRPEDPVRGGGSEINRTESSRSETGKGGGRAIEEGKWRNERRERGIGG